ncbi:MAG TPA: alpha/beta fold hydrolase [Pseudonocardiaceae bacterium]
MADDLWLRVFHPAPERPVSLVCLPHAGGAASSFFGFSAAMDASAEVVVVQYPGRQNRWRDEPFANLPSLADAVSDAVLRHLPGPVALFGHSMGAAVAFEVTRRLERAGRAPVRLFASGSRAPSLERTEGVHELDDDGLIAELTRLGGTDPRLLEDREMLEMMLPAVRADYTAIETYRAPDDARVGCPVTVLTGDNDPRTTLDSARAWARHTTADCDVREYPGGHFFLFDDVERITEDVSKVLAA